MHSHAPMHTTKKRQNNNSKMLNSPNMMPSLMVLFLSSVLVGDFQEAWHLLHFQGLVA